MKILKFLKSVGKDFLKDIIIPAVFVSIICGVILLIISNINPSTLETIGTVFIVIFLIGAFVLFIGVIIADLVKYLKKKWSEVK